MTTHLKPKQEYIDRYDRMTDERCRDLIKRHSQPLENPPLIDGQKPTEKLVETVSKMALDWSLMFEKGHRYIKKGETIDRWMRDDQEKDELYESAKEPEGIRCLTCRSKMFVTHKMLWGGYEEPYRVLFMFDCPNGCLPRRSFYNDGEERKHKPDLCEKCSSELAVKLEDTKEKFITHYSCSSCGFAKTDEIERTANKENEPDPNFEADKARLVNEAITAKKVAFKFAGAELAIQASIGIMEICPSGDSNAVSIKAINRASTNPPVIRAVHSCKP